FVGIALALGTAAFGQSERGTIQGAVHDSSGAAIVNARVTVTNPATNVKINTSSNGAGDYAVASLPPGAYVVRVEKEGFRTALISNISVNASATVRVDATLDVGSITQTVEVTASALQLQTEDAKSGVTITGQMVDKLAVVVSGN